MKNKIVLTLLLALLSVAAYADNTRVYCKMTQSWWTADNAAVGVYCWGGVSMTWPGERMKKVSGDPGVWYVDLDASKVNGLIFTRVNPSGTVTDWAAKTKDLTLPADGKNLFTITTSTGCWNGNGNNCECTGSWSAYTEPAPADYKFYITGDSALVVDAGVGVDKAWNAKAIKSQNESYTLSLKAGVNYKLKVTEDGTWDTGKGYSDLTNPKADGLSKDKDDNICFSLETAGNVKVTYTSEVFKLEGNFHVEPIVPGEKKIVKLVPSDEWKIADAKFAAWTWGNDIESQWTAWFAPVSSGNDTLQAEILAAADSIDFVRFSPKAANPTWEQSGEDVLVWGEMKDKIDFSSLVWTVIGWTDGQWTPVDKPCESYGLMVDGVFVPGQKNVLQTEWTEYMLRGLELTAGQKIQIHDACHDASWVMEQFAPTSYEFEIKEIDGKKYYVVGESGKYDFYIKFIFENDEVYISKEGTYTTAVRDQCTDVMMQAFFNESYSNDAPGVSATKDYKLGLGNTKWTTLLAQADSIGKYFDLVWLPPSANGDGMGYHPKQYSNQSSNWGSTAELVSLISALHNAGSKVIADIVINHCTGWTTWCDFPTMDFGDYGVFHPDASYICKNDEVNLNPDAGACYGKATGSYDDGENWDGARDWSHDNVYVQDMFKAYLKWMKNVMLYDGWRYDKGDGFNNWHHDNYNKASGPYIAFMESYNGTDKIQAEIAQANYNLMALDFDLKWHVFNSFAGWDYSRGRGDGLIGRGDGRHAVTFIESHDWFLRNDNENEFGGRGNSLTPALKGRLLQANAFLLSMPGVPCVFYPHWKKYGEELKSMINARKWAGVHSESEVRDEYSNATGYQATMVGKYGYLILCLGDKANKQGFGANYKLMSSNYSTKDGHNESYEIWVHRTSPIPTDVEETKSADVRVKSEKFVKDGQLFIRVGDRVFDVTGRLTK